MKSTILFFLGYLIASCGFLFAIFRYKNKRGGSKNKVIRKSIFYGAIMAFAFSVISSIIDFKSKNPEYKVCDRDVDNGCAIDLPDMLNWKIYVEGVGGALQYTVSVGDNQTVGKLQFIDNQADINPQIPTKMGFPKADSPYEISCDIKNLYFTGDVKEFKNNELIGWFDKNDFGSYDCKMIWNKDECGLEILDKYGYVVFSVDYIPSTEKIEFRGYYREDEMVYVFNEKYYMTNNLKHAENLISQIKPIFKHRGRNSTGVRINKRLCN